MEQSVAVPRGEDCPPSFSHFRASKEDIPCDITEKVQQNRATVEEDRQGSVFIGGLHSTLQRATARQRGGRSDNDRDDDPTLFVIDDLYEEARRIGAAANKKATIFKFLTIGTEISIIILGLMIAIFSLNDCQIGSESTSYTVGVLGAIVSAIGAARSTFDYSKRGFLFKTINQQASGTAHKLMVLRNCSNDLTTRQIQNKINIYYDRLAKLDLSMYSVKDVKYSSPISAPGPFSNTAPETPAYVPPDGIVTFGQDKNRVPLRP